MTKTSFRTGRTIVAVLFAMPFFALSVGCGRGVLSRSDRVKTGDAGRGTGGTTVTTGNNGGAGDPGDAGGARSCATSIDFANATEVPVPLGPRNHVFMNPALDAQPVSNYANQIVFP